MVAAASPAWPLSRTWPKKASPPICPPLSTISNPSLTGSLTCARNSGARLAGPRRLQLWVAHHPGRRADILALDKWLVQEMREMASTGDLAVP